MLLKITVVVDEVLTLALPAATVEVVVAVSALRMLAIKLLCIGLMVTGEAEARGAVGVAVEEGVALGT